MAYHTFMKVLVTGTHFTPAVAVIEQFGKYHEVELIYVGRKTVMEGENITSLESKILPKMRVKFIALITGRLQRAFTIYSIPSLFKIPLGLIQSFFIILTEKPDVVLSFGGYVAVPVVIIAWLFSIPIIIHEQTLVAGLANSISSFFADKIAISFAGVHFNNKPTVLTGNPLRNEILKVNNKTLHKEKLPLILVTGGNQGSHIINVAVESCLKELLKIACVIHQTGDSRYKDFERLTYLQNDRYIVKKFIDDMGKVLSMVDVVISRSGINILTELAYFGKPALVIPIPYLFADEQNKNAQFFKKLGLVKILPQSQLSAKILLANVKLILNDLNHFKKEAKCAKAVVIPDAAKRLALETILLAGQKFKQCAKE